MFTPFVYAPALCTTQGKQQDRTMSPNWPASSRFHYAYLIVAAGIVIAGIPCALVLSCAGIFFSPVSSHFAVPTAHFTAYFSILNLLMMLTLPLAGRLLQRHNARWILSAAVAVDGLTFCAMAAFQHIWLFYLAGACLGVATAPLIYLAIPTLLNAWCQQNVGFFIGLCMAFTGIGGAVFNALGSALIAQGDEGWRSAYLVFGLLTLLVALPCTVFIVRSKPSSMGLMPYGAQQSADPAEQEESASAVKPAAAATSTPGLESGLESGSMSASAHSEAGCGRGASTKLAFAMAALFSLCIGFNQFIYMFMPSYVLSFDGPRTELLTLGGLLASFCMAGQALGKVALGAVNDRSVKAGLFFAVTCGICGVLCMALLPQFPPVLLAGGFLFGFVYACNTVQTPLLVRAVFGNADFARMYARIAMFGAFSGIVAPTLLGLLADLEYGYRIMFALSLGCMLISLAAGHLAVTRMGKA